MKHAVGVFAEGAKECTKALANKKIVVLNWLAYRIKVIGQGMRFGLSPYFK